MTATRILITGSRNWTDRQSIYEALDLCYWSHLEDELVVVHGDARGADSIAGHWARLMHLVDTSVSEEWHPADWEQHGKAAGHIRNHHMVGLGADLCLAFPLGESRGTRGCMAAARKAGIRVKEIN